MRHHYSGFTPLEKIGLHFHDDGFSISKRWYLNETLWATLLKQEWVLAMTCRTMMAFGMRKHHHLLKEKKGVSGLKMGKGWYLHLTRVHTWGSESAGLMKKCYVSGFGRNLCQLVPGWLNKWHNLLIAQPILGWPRPVRPRRAAGPKARSSCQPIWLASNRMR